MERKHEPVTPKTTQQERLAELGRNQAHLMHELRQPLVTIGLLARSIRKRDALGGKDRDQLDTIVELVSSAEALLRDSLHFVAPKGGTMRPANVASLLRGIRRTLLPLATLKGVSVLLECDQRGSSVVSCNRRRVRHALLNIAQNALEAMADEGGTLTLQCRQTPNGVVVTIRDNGPGIGPETRSKMFRPFYSTKKRGTGLGLALAKKIVQDHEGRILVRSSPGKGTSVTVRLPRSGS